MNEVIETFLQESPDFGKQFFAPADYEACDYAANLLASNLNNSLREGFLDILNKVDLYINNNSIKVKMFSCNRTRTLSRTKTSCS